MKLLEKLERKFGKYGGIQNLTVIIIACYVVGYLIYMVNPNALDYLSLEPYYILRGQIWRLVTWVIYPPQTSSAFWFILAVLFFYYPIGTSLERSWGSLRYTVYIVSGLIFTILSSFLLYGIWWLIYGSYAYPMGGLFSTYYISLSIFLAYAMTCPDMKILLYFIIPIKMKWMALFYVVIIGYEVIYDVVHGYWYLTIPIIASLLNFIIFYFSTRDFSRFDPKEQKRRRDFRQAMEPKSRVGRREGFQVVSKHKCAICGRTELDNPLLEFRFCSKCKGNYEYCQDHLYTHTHVQ